MLFSPARTPSTTLPRTGESGLVYLFLMWGKALSIYFTIGEVGYFLRWLL